MVDSVSNEEGCVTVVILRCLQGEAKVDLPGEGQLLQSQIYNIDNSDA